MIFQGKVIKGQKLAKKMGVATANIQLFDAGLSEEGVYIVESSILGKSGKIKGVMHYGTKKILDNKFSIEVHLLDFSKDIYGEILEIKILKKIREVKKFDSLENLFIQINKDVIGVRKYFLRKEIKECWAKLSTKEEQDLAKKAFERISNLAVFLEAKNVYIYAPKKDEIKFISELCKKFPDKNYFFPKIVNKEMKFFRGIYSELKSGKWGILEPDSSIKKDELKPDLILVPALAADKSGNRLGNGKGFYDRFLQENPAKKICILPEFAVFDEIPVEEHDVVVDEVIFF